MRLTADFDSEPVDSTGPVCLHLRQRVNPEHFGPPSVHVEQIFSREFSICVELAPEHDWAAVRVALLASPEFARLLRLGLSRRPVTTIRPRGSKRGV